MRILLSLLAGAAALLAFAAPAAAVTFAPAAGSPFATRSVDTIGLDLADLDVDGRLDAIVADRGAGEVALLRGLAAGAFAAPAVTTIAGAAPVRVHAADFDDDGFPDVLVQRQNQANATVLLNDGTGALAPVAGSPFAAAAEIWSMDVADVTGDGVPDVVAALLDGRVQVLAGSGDGTLVGGSAFDFGGGMLPIVASGRLNADRHVDLVLASRTSSTLTVLRGHGDGTFAVAPGGPFAVGTEPSALVVADLDGDGDLDAATANQSAGTVTVALGDGMGGLTAGSTVAAPFTPVALAAGDVDGDGDTDLAVARYASSDVQVLVNAGDGTFATDSDPATAAIGDPNALTAADLDGDGLADLQVLGRGLLASLRNASVSAATVDQPALGFAGQAVGTLGGGQTVTVTSAGALRLDVERLRLEGAAADDFLLLQDTCSGRSFARGAACSVRVRFAPTATGARAATLVLDSDASGTAPTVVLTGTGLASPVPADGNDGADGRDGVVGPAGPIGPAGPVGPAGPDGPAGTTGPVGPAGPRGQAAPIVPAAPRGTCNRIGTRSVRCTVVLSGALAGRRDRVVARLLLGGRSQVAAARTRARDGRVVATLRGRRALPRGRYRLVVAATARKGAPASSVWITIR